MGTRDAGLPGLGRLARDHYGEFEPIRFAGVIPAGYGTGKPAEPIRSLRLKPARHGEATHVSVSHKHVCIVTSWGGVKCWGDNSHLALGRGSEGGPHFSFEGSVGDDEFAFYQMGVYTLGRARSVHTTTGFSCVFHEQGTFECWGSNEFQQLGYRDETDTSSMLPSAVSKHHFVNFPPLTHVACGYHTTCVITEAGRLACFGLNHYGEAGHARSTTPDGVAYPQTLHARLQNGSDAYVDLLAPVSRVSIGGGHTCAVLVDGRVQCFGRNDWGQRGLLFVVDNVPPTIGLTEAQRFTNPGGDSAMGWTEVPNDFGAVKLPSGTFVIDISCGAGHTCALTSTGEVVCWGKGGVGLGIARSGWLGYGSPDSVGDSPERPINQTVQLSGRAVGISAGIFHTCAVLHTGQVQCWGEGVRGELGLGNVKSVGDDETPAQAGVAQFPRTVLQVAAGRSSTCVLLKGGYVHCIGLSEQGQGGIGNDVSVSTGDLPRFMRTPRPMALDLSANLLLGPVSPIVRVVGSKVAWRSIIQVVACPACAANELLSLPRWLILAMKGGQEVDLPLPEAAAGGPCRQLPTDTNAPDGSSLLGEHTRICRVYTKCLEPQDVTVAGSSNPFLRTCQWPEAWQMADLLRISKVTSGGASQQLSSLPSRGGVSVSLHGAFWPILALDGESSTVSRSWVAIGNSTCAELRLMSTNRLFCIAPALPAANVSGGLDLFLHHNIVDVPSPVISAPAARIYYSQPTLSRIDVVGESSLAPITAPATIIVRGNHLGRAQEAAESAGSWTLPPAALQVRVYSSETGEAAFLYNCPVFHASSFDTEIMCELPGGMEGMLWIGVEVAGQVAPQRVLVCRQAPRVQGVLPTYLLPAPTAFAPGQRTANVTIFGSGFLPPGTPLAPSDFSVSIAGALCPLVLPHNSSMIHCVGLPLDAISPLTARQDAVQVFVLGRKAEVDGSVQLDVLQPRINTVEPTSLAAGGNQTLRIFGELGRAADDIVSASVGNATCSLTPQEPPSAGALTVHCSTPPARLACESDAACQQQRQNVSVQLRTGLTLQAPPGSNALYLLPEVLSVSLFSSDGSAVESMMLGMPNVSMTYTLQVRGTGLGNPEQPELTTLLILGEPCTILGGIQTLASSGELSCVDFDTQGLQLVDGVSPLEVRSAGYVDQSSRLQIMGHPAITRVSPSLAAPGTQVTILGEHLGVRASDVASVRVGSVPVTWAWESASSISFNLPPPASFDKRDVEHVNVSLTLISGQSVVAAAAVSYTLPPRPPVSAPTDPCVFRTADAVASVLFKWQDDRVTEVHPVQQWVITYTDTPWAPLDDQRSRLRAILSGAAEVSSVDPDAPGEAVLEACPHTLQAMHGTSGLLVLISLPGIPERPHWLRVSASTGVAGQLLPGPRSVAAGPLFARCSSGGETEQFLSTHLYRPPGNRHQHWRNVLCMPCPEGGKCGGAPAEAVVPLQGWFRAAWAGDHPVFVKCPIPAACPRTDLKVVNASQLQYLQPPQGAHAAQAPPAAFTAYMPASSLTGNASSEDTSAASDPTIVQCANGFDGRLCGVCGSGFTMAGGNNCVKCPHASLAWLQLFGGLLLICAGLAYLISTTLASRGEPTKPYIALNKLLFTHLQQVGIAAAFPYSWPPALRRLFEAFDATSSVSDAIISVDCILPTAASVFTSSRYAQLALPIVLLAGIACFWAVLGAWRDRSSSVPLPALASTTTGASKVPSGGRIGQEDPAAQQIINPLTQQPIVRGKRKSRRATARASIIAAAVAAAAAQSSGSKVKLPALTSFVVSTIVALFVLHLSLVRASLSLVTCVGVGGRRFLAGDLNIDCDDPQQYLTPQAIGLVSLVVYGVGIPAAGFYILLSKRKELSAPEVRATYGFLYITYTPERYFWEVLVQARKFALALTSVLLAPVGVGMQTCCAMVLLVGCLILQERAQPFRMSMLNMLESCSIAVSVASLAGGAALVDAQVPVDVKQAVSVLLIALNVAFVLTMVGLLCRSVASHSPARAAVRRLARAASRLGRLGGGPASVAKAGGDKPRAPAPGKVSVLVPPSPASAAPVKALTADQRVARVAHMHARSKAVRRPTGLAKPMQQRSQPAKQVSPAS